MRWFLLPSESHGVTGQWKMPKSHQFLIHNLFLPTPRNQKSYFPKCLLLPTLWSVCPRPNGLQFLLVWLFFSFASDKHVTWFASYALMQALFLSPSLSPAEQVRDFLILSAGKANDSEIRSNRGARSSVLASNDRRGAEQHSLYLIITMNDMVCGHVNCEEGER